MNAGTRPPERAGRARSRSRWSLYLLVLVGGVGWLLGRGALDRRPTVPPPDLGSTAAVEGWAPEVPAAVGDRRLALRLLDPRGRPVSGAEVAVRGAAGGPPVRTRADELGLVRLTLPARVHDHDPLGVFVGGPGQVAWRPLPADGGWLGDVRLGEPLARRGRLELPDGTPAGGLPLRLRQVGLVGDADGRAFELFEELADPGRAGRAVELVTDPLGGFALEGLDPGLYLVESRPDGPADYERLYLASHRGSLVELFEDPVGPLELVVDGLACELALLDRRFEPQGGARFELDGLATDGERYARRLELSEAEFEGRLWLPPTRTLTVTGGRADLLAVRRTVDLGEEPGGVLRVELESDGLPGVALLRPRLLAGDGRALPFLVEATRVEADGERAVELPVLTDDPEWYGPLEPGSWRLTLVGQGDRHPLGGGRPLPFEPLPVRVELRAGEARTLDLPAVPARRLRLTLEEGVEGLVEVRLVTDGAVVPLTFVDPADGRRRRLPRGGAVQLAYEPLPHTAARLEFEFADGRTVERPLAPGEQDAPLTLGP